jgi:hypothetical protein
VSKRTNGPMPADISKRDAKFTQGSSQQYNESFSNGAGLEK